ncbi:MAG: hypothetical protein KF788_06135, partial [Piscinibacter sp.]|nr:hypothetical protein [Piscinibacter sp.]
MAHMRVKHPTGSTPPGSAPAGADGRAGPGPRDAPPTWRAPRPGEERRRLVRAVLLSLLAHALVLSLTFGGDHLGLPGLLVAWQERRIEAPPLRIVLVPAPTPPEPQPSAAPVPPLTSEPTKAPSAGPA